MLETMCQGFEEYYDSRRDMHYCLESEDQEDNHFRDSQPTSVTIKYIKSKYQKASTWRCGEII